MIYDYLNGKIKNIKENTKFRLLGISMLYNKEYTLNFILNRLTTLISSIAYSNIDLLYEKLIDTKKYEEFEKLYFKFLNLLQENQFFLAKNFQNEILQLYSHLQSEKSRFVQNYFFKNYNNPNPNLFLNIPTPNPFPNSYESPQIGGNTF